MRKSLLVVIVTYLFLGGTLVIALLAPRDAKLPAFLAEGGVALGGAIAWLVVFFLKRFSVFDPKVLGSVVCIVAGGTVTNFLGTNGSDAKLGAWAGYCVGLFLGVCVFEMTSEGHNPKSPDAKNTLAQGTNDDSTDPRMLMLDEAHKRYAAGTLSYSDFSDLKYEILKDVKENPHWKGKSPGTQAK